MFNFYVGEEETCEKREIVFFFADGEREEQQEEGTHF